MTILVPALIALAILVSLVWCLAAMDAAEKREYRRQWAAFDAAWDEARAEIAARKAGEE